MARRKRTKKPRFAAALFALLLLLLSPPPSFPGRRGRAPPSLLSSSPSPFCRAFRPSTAARVPRVGRPRRRQRQQRRLDVTDDISEPLPRWTDGNGVRGGSGWMGRRDAAMRISAAGSALAASVPLLAVLLPGEEVRAASGPTYADAGEAVRVGASAIPGLGQPDVYYPSNAFRGTWKCRREVASASATTGDGSGDDQAAASASTRRLEYSVRFVPSVKGRDAAVADRGYNQANLEAALRGGGGGSAKAEGGEVLRSCTWTQTNPNDLRIVYADGSLKEIKVTKRATEMTDSTVYSSEFQRVTTQEAGAASVPSISARRVLTKWKVLGDGNHIEGLELVYDVGGAAIPGVGVGGDPMSMQLKLPTSQEQQQKLLLKSRLYLEREQ